MDQQNTNGMAENIQSVIAKTARDIGVLANAVDAAKSANDLDHLRIAGDIQTLDNGLKNLSNRVESLDVAGAVINDADPTAVNTTFSASKTVQVIDSAIAKVVGASPAELDTIEEVVAKIHQDETGLAAIVEGQANFVRFNVLQEKPTEQQAIARVNIGAAAASEVTALTARVDATVTALGNTSVDFMAAYTLSLAEARASGVTAL